MSKEKQQSHDAREQKRARFSEPEPPSGGSSTKAIVLVAAIVIIAVAAVLATRGGDSGSSGPARSAVPAGSGAGASPRPTPAAQAAPAARPARALAPEGGAYTIALADVSTSASFFTANEGGKSVPFFAVRDASGKAHVALDACSVCANAKKGYTQTGDAMECRNCGQTFAIAKLTDMAGKGGCHPIVLPAHQTGESLVVQTSDVAAGAKWF